MKKILLTSVGNDGAQAIISALKTTDNVMPSNILIGVDMNPQAYGLHMADFGYVVAPRSKAESLLHDLQTIITKHNIDLIVPLSTEDQLFYAQHAKTLESYGCTVQHSPHEYICIANNKHLLLPFLKERSIAVPNFCLANNPSELEKLLNDFGINRNPIVIKQEFSTGASGVKIVMPETNYFNRFFERDNIYISKQELFFWLEQYKNSIPPLQVSEFLPDARYSADIFLNKGKPLVVCLRTEEKRIYGTSLYGTTFHDEELYNLSMQAASALCLHGVANIEMGRDSYNKAKIIEVNPRFPASIDHTIAAGCNMPYWVVQAALKQPFTTQKPLTGITYYRHWTSSSHPKNSLTVNR